MELWLVGLGLVDEFRQAIHLFFARRDQARRPIGLVNDPGFGLAADEIDHLGEDRGGGVVKLGMGLRAAGVPIAERFPAVRAGSKDIPLTR